MTGLILIVCGIHLWLNGTDEDSIRFIIQWTAKCSAFLFILAFGASSASFLFRDKFSRKLLEFRPQLGLSFAVFHSFHLFFLLYLQNTIHPVFTLAKKSSLIGGSMAYIFMYLMVITTFPFIKSKMTSIRWTILHLIGGYWIWLIFFRTYYKKVVHWNEEYIMFSLIILVMLLRFTKVILRRRKAK